MSNQSQNNNKTFSPKIKIVLFLAIFVLLFFGFLILPKIQRAQALETAYIAPTVLHSNSCTAPTLGGNFGDNNPPATTAYVYQCDSDSSPNVEDAVYFDGFSFGLPSDAIVSGVEVNLNNVSLNSTRTGTQDMKVRLSWDNGTNWTAAAQNDSNTCTTGDLDSYVTLTGGEFYCTDKTSTADVGSDPATGTLWGRASWTISELSSDNFVVQVTADNSNSSARVQYIDLVYVKIYYSLPAVTTISGTLYSGEGTGVQDGTIKVAVATSTPGIFTTTTSGGAWSISAIGLWAGIPIAAWWDAGGAGNYAYVISKATTSAATVISGLDLYKNRVIVRHEGSATATSTTIADLAFYDADNDADIQFTANSGNLDVFKGQELHIWTGTGFLTGGTIKLHGNMGSSPDGDFHLDTNASTTLTSTVTLAGNWTTGTNAIFKNGGYTVMFNATTTGKTISGNMVGSNAFSGLTFNGSGGLWTFSNNASTTGTFQISAGTVIAPALLSIGGTYSVTDIFNNNGGTVLIDGSAQQTLTGIMTGTSAFYNLQILNNSGSDATTSPSVIFSTNASTTNNFIVTTASVKIRFAASGLYTFTNMTLDGKAAGTRVMFRSSGSGTPWLLVSTGTQSVLYTDPKDSDASGGDQIDASDASNVNSGNNTNWNFPPPPDVPVAYLSQQSYRFQNISNIDTGEFIYPKGDSFSDQTNATSTPLTDVKIGERMFLRINVENTGDLSATDKVFKLRFGTGGSCPGTCSWADITNSSAISYASGLLGEMADYDFGGATSSQIFYPSPNLSSSYSWTEGRYAVGTSTVGAVTLSVSYQTEFVFGLDTTNAVASAQYFFRLYNVTDGAELNSYTVTPSLTIVSPTSDTKRYSKNVLDSAPLASDASTSLPYFLDNEGYTNLASNDTGTSTVKLTSTDYEKQYPQLQISGSKIYYTWSECDTGTAYNCPDGKHQIWLATSNLDGTATTTTQLTSTSYAKYYSQFQISGSKIYYTWRECDTATTCTGYYQIWLGTSNLDGTATTTKMLTSTSHAKYNPQLQISGSKIYYTWYEEDGTYYQTWLATSNLDGTATTTTKLTSTSYHKYYPQFQISGSKIYYTWSESDGTYWQIWLATSNLDGTNPTAQRLTSTSYTKFNPQFQISGSKIYYTWHECDGTVSACTGQYFQIWLATSNLDGTATTTVKLATTSYKKVFPQFQISGSRIYYTWAECSIADTSCTGGNFQIWFGSSNLDGTATTTLKLTSTSYSKQYPQFQISGSKIYYTWLECDGTAGFCSDGKTKIWLGVQTFGDKLQASNPTFLTTTPMTSTPFTKYITQLQISGSKIYYTWYECNTATTCSGSYNIWLGSSNLDGTATSTTPLTGTSVDKRYPQFQISGSKIYYTWEQEDGSYDQIWLATSNLDGTATTTLKLTTTNYIRSNPQFQISGSKIYYAWYELDGSSRYQIWHGSSNLNGTGFVPTKLTSSAYNKSLSQFQVSGSKIYYTWDECDVNSISCTGYYQIWHGSSNLDGTGFTPTKFTSASYQHNKPQFQISGSKIYYTWAECNITEINCTGGNYQIWHGSSNLNGTGFTPTQLTSTSYGKSSLQFQISGSKIYYTWSETDGSRSQIWLATSNLDGTATTTTKLTTSTGYSNYYPQFQISGSKIYYTWNDDSDGAHFQIRIGNNWGYNQFNFREKNSNATADEISVSWNGQASLTGSSTPLISLQVYNRNSSLWETLQSSNTYSTSTDFSLSGSVTTDFSYYYDDNWWTAFRVTQGSWEDYLETDYFLVTFTSSAPPSSLTLSDLTVGQESNKFDIPTGNNSTSSAEMFSFKLYTAGNNSVTNLIISLSDIRGFVTANLSIPKIYVDTNDDGAIGTTETTTVGGTGAVAITGSSGTITFSTQFSVSGSKSYILRIDTISSIDAGDQMTLRLWRQDITLNGADITGYVTPAIHIKTGGISGGGEIGYTSVAGTTQPGGEESAGELIGSEPGFMAPSSNSGSWTSGENAYSSNNTYASSASDDQNHDYSSFGFTISGNIIDGIEVKLEANSIGGASNAIDVTLSWNSGSNYTSTSTTSNLTSSDTVYRVGGSSSNWGRSWSASEFGITFIMRVTSSIGIGTIYLDAIQVKVYSHAGGGGPGGGGEL